MTIRAEVRDYLLALPAISNTLGSRLHALRAPNTTTPYGLLSVQAHDAIGHLRGVTKLENVRMRLDLFGENYAQLVTLSEAVIDAMASASGFASTYVFGTELYEDDTRLFHVILDFSVWNHRA